MAHRIWLVQNIQAAGHEVIVAAGNCNGGSKPDQLETIDFIPLDLDRHAFNLLGDIRLVKTLARLIKTLKPDVVHLFTIKPILYTGIAASFFTPRLLRQSTRFVMTFAGLGKVFESANRVREKLRRILVEQFLKISNRRLEIIATFENAGGFETMVQKKIFKRQQCLVIMGAGIELVEKSPPARSGPLQVSFASRLLKEKGVDTFIAVARQINAHGDGKGTRFVLAGPIDPTNPDSIALETIQGAEKEGTIQYLGFLDSDGMSELLASTDVLCLPTRLTEGLPRVLLEAAASGCALIASDQPACHNIVQAGETGWLLEKADEESLYVAINDAINNDSETREKGKRAHILANKLPISNDSVFNRFLSLYQGSMDD